MRATLLASALCAMLVSAAMAQLPGARCGAGRDLVVQALESVSAQSTDVEVVHANELLKRAAQMCSSLGDAWYYRSVMERRLRNENGAKFARGRAELVGSEAMEEGINPFQLATQPGERTNEAAGTTWALVIGINKFADADLNTLKYTATDAELFAHALEDPRVGAFPKDHVHLLLNGDATTRNIKANLNWIARQAKPEDLVVVYVATHGAPREYDSVAGISYLITADTEGGSSVDEDALYATAFPVIELVNSVATRIRALRTAVFVDACYSGGIRAIAGDKHAASLDDRILQKFRQGSGRIVMSAAREDQEANESGKLEHGYFTYYLVQALQTAGGTTPLTSVFTNVRGQVMAHVAEDLKAFHVHQEPVMARSSETTDFALGAPRGAAGVQP